MDRLQCTDLIVGIHNTDQNRVRTDCIIEHITVDDPVSGDGQVGDLKSLLFQKTAGVQDSVMLDGGGDDVAAFAGRGSGCV